MVKRQQTKKLVGSLVPVVLAASVAGLSLLAASPEAGSQNLSACPPVKGGLNLSVQIDQGRVVYDHTLTKTQLRRLASRNQSVTIRPGEQPLGLTRRNMRTGSSMESQTVNLSRNRYCARLSKVNIDIIFDQLKVYVLREYGRGSCQYDAVLAHEHRHVSLSRNVLTKHRSIIERKIRQRILAMKPAVASSRNRANQQMYSRLEQLLVPLIKDMEREMNAANEKIDTPASYARFRKQCRRW